MSQHSGAALHRTAPHWGHHQQNSESSVPCRHEVTTRVFICNKELCQHQINMSASFIRLFCQHHTFTQSRQHNHIAITQYYPSSTALPLFHYFISITLLRISQPFQNNTKMWPSHYCIGNTAKVVQLCQFDTHLSESHNNVCILIIFKPNYHS